MPKSTSLTAAIFCSLLVSAGVPALRDSYHNDHRQTPKLQFFSGAEGSVSSKSLASAEAFLEQNHQQYALPAGAANLQLVQVRQSLVGRHHHYQQMLNGYKVKGAELIISTSLDDNRVYKVFNNTYPEYAARKAPQKLIAPALAYDAAWKHLRVHGELQLSPSAELVYVPDGRGFRLVYLVNLAVEKPHGFWEQQVDAVTGKVVSTRNTATMCKTHGSHEKSPSFDTYTGPILDRTAAFERQTVRAEARRAEKTQGKKADGAGLVFDPDPRTTLQNDSLEDFSPATSFDAAYIQKPLRDITVNGNTYSLVGPWVNIGNFDTPNNTPSTTSDGNWTQKRGDNAFNEANVYFHVDQNQRYIQSLGFTGANNNGIQFGPINVDTDGAQGADQSFFTSQGNILSFGRGCVDDAEDADVILHEYGHSLHWSINNNWGGGDTGGIGEGFGDYWAGSYSYSTTNGAAWNPYWMFSWDGHNACWDGRVMDALTTRYDATRSYGAHQSIGGGYQSDELWSTPLFNALVELIGQGVPREEVDQIVLESHFGLGFGVNMREMANATVAAAVQLYPNGPHAQTFIDNFLRHELIEPVASEIVVAGIDVISSGTDTVAEPGETANFIIALTNSGNLSANDVSATLSTTTPGVTISGGSSAYPNIPPGATRNNGTAYTMNIGAGLACGATIDLTITISYTDGGGASHTAALSTSIALGQPNGGSWSSQPSSAIPDNSSTGLTDTITISGTGSSVTSNFNLDLNLTHTYIGDLVIILTSPSGTRIRLHDQSGAGSDNIVGNYPQTLTPANALSGLVGEPIDGEWSLLVRDLAAEDTGTLNAWGINDVSGYTCSNDGGNLDFSMYYTFTENNTTWRTNLGIINPGDATTTIVFSGRNAQGQTVAQANRSLPANGRLWESMTDLFGERSDIASVQVDSDAVLRGYSDSVDPARTQSFAIEATATLYQQLNVPHVAEADIFWTVGHLMNGGNSITNVTFTATGSNQIEVGQMAAKSSQPIDYKSDFFNLPIPSGTGWGVFRNDAGTSTMAGVEVFGQSPQFSNAAGLLLSDFSATRLIMPHIPSDKAAWWAGLVLVNINDSFANVTAHGFDAAGQSVATNTFQINANTKMSALLENYFPNTNVDTVEWVLFESDTPLTGYELFGTTNRDAAIAGLEALSAGVTEQYLAHIQASGVQWTGIGLVNPGDLAAQVTFTLYDQDGNQVGQSGPLNLAARSKQIGLADTLFTLPPEGGWAKVNSTQPIIVFELFGENGLRMVSGINALR